MNGLSINFKLLRFPLIIGVVFIHAYGTEVNLNGYSKGLRELSFGLQLIQDIIAQGFARLAVPVFFFMSGFLFFYDFKLSWLSYRSKLKNRVGTLLIPYLFWNLLMMLMFFIFQSVDATKVYFSGSMQFVSTYNVFDFINNLFGLNKPPISYQFWFIRDLMVLVLLSPLFYLAFSKFLRAVIFLTFLICVYLFGVSWLYIPSIDALLFFVIGGFAASYGKLDIFVKKYTRYLTIVYLTLLTIDLASTSLVFNATVHKISLIVGVFACLGWSESLVENKYSNALLTKLAPTSFYVFALHEPILTFLRKIFYSRYFDGTEIDVMISFFLLPMATVTVCLITYFLLKYTMPSVLGFVVGRR